MSAGLDHGLQGLMVSFEVRDKDLHTNTGIEELDPKDSLGKVGRAAVEKIVPVHRGDHDVFQSQVFDYQAHIARLFRV